MDKPQRDKPQRDIPDRIWLIWRDDDVEYVLFSHNPEVCVDVQEYADKLKTALKIYADKKNWMGEVFIAEPTMDNCKIARMALYGEPE